MKLPYSLHESQGVAFCHIFTDCRKSCLCFADTAIIRPPNTFTVFFSEVKLRIVSFPKRKLFNLLKNKSFLRTCITHS